MLKAGSQLVGDSGQSYTLICPLTSLKAQSYQNVWKAVNSTNEREEVVIKAPSNYDDRTAGYPAFSHELEMQRRFRDSPLIRGLIDFIPGDDTNAPKMVLQGFEETLWAARNRRPFSKDEIKWVMHGVLLALWTVHREGLVYSGTYAVGLPFIVLLRGYF
jgi:hypothetical protein